jgi:hypothetical protein
LTLGFSSSKPAPSKTSFGLIGVDAYANLKRSANKGFCNQKAAHFYNELPFVGYLFGLQFWYN